MHGDADGAGLVGDGPGDGLPDPPGGIGGEFVALCVVELVHGPDQARVALLDQIQDVQAAAGILLRNGDHQPEVGLGELVLGVFVALRHPGGQLLLLLRGQQPDLSDLLEIHPHRIVQVVLCGQLHRIHQVA